MGGPWLRRPGMRAGRQRDVLDHGACGGEERAFVSVAPPHQVGRAAIRTANVGEHALPIGVTHVESLDNQFVADSCFHHSPPVIAMSYSIGTRPRATRIGTKAPAITADRTPPGRVL